VFFVMKISKLCNLRCTYCYEYDELGMRDRMALEDVESFIAGLAAHQPTGGWPPLRFVLHSGEPTLLQRSTSRALLSCNVSISVPPGSPLQPRSRRT
jgi:uncharacterized protein